MRSIQPKRWDFSMRIHLKNTQIHLDLPMLLFPIIASLLGEGEMAMMLIGSLAAHEAAHLGMARAVGLSIRTLRLTPFGGLAQLDNPYAASAPRLCAVSAAGPLANLMILLASGALCQWNWLPPGPALQIMQINAMLLLFNLLPALPLDGGRILYALLSTHLPRSRAVEMGILLGRILSAALMLLTVWGLIRHHMLNLSPLFAALFILISAQDERRALADSRVQNLLDCLRPLEKPCAAALVAVDTSISPEAALRALHPGEVTLFALYENGRFSRLVDDRTLLEKVIKNDGERPQ